MGKVQTPQDPGAKGGPAGLSPEGPGGFTPQFCRLGARQAGVSRSSVRGSVGRPGWRVERSDSAPRGGQRRGHPGGEPGPQDAFRAGGTRRVRNPPAAGQPHGQLKRGHVLPRPTSSRPRVLGAAQGLSSPPKRRRLSSRRALPARRTMNFFFFFFLLFFLRHYADLACVTLMSLKPVLPETHKSMSAHFFNVLYSCLEENNSKMLSCRKI